MFGICSTIPAMYTEYVNVDATGTDVRSHRKKFAAAQLRRPIATARLHKTSIQNRRTSPKAARQCNILATLNDAERGLLLRHCIRQEFNPGSNLFAQGQRHSLNFIIESGLVRTFHSSPTGKEITLAYWKEGDLIGGPNFFDDSDSSRHVWSAETMESTRVLAISGRDLKHLTMTTPKIAECVIDALSFKLLWLSLLLQMLGTKSVSKRLAQLLLQLSALYGVESRDGVEIRYSFTQEDLANMVGATRQWVSSTLSRFQREKIIHIGKRKLLILVPSRLQELSM